MSELVFRVLEAAVWRKVVSNSSFAGSEHDQRDGFIHLSSGSQVAATLARHYSAQTDLCLLEINATALGDSLRWEASNGGEEFPHLYGPLATAAVNTVYPLPLDDKGLHELPSSLGESG
ncbi:MAG: DUF952 domain-containing protein [Planctomycetota bacterium]